MDFLGGTQSVLHAIETLVAGASLLACPSPTSTLTWNVVPPKGRFQGHYGRKAQEPKLMQFQALLFGLYYRLFEDLISIEVRGGRLAAGCSEKD